METAILKSVQSQKRKKWWKNYDLSHSSLNRHSLRTTERLRPSMVVVDYVLRIELDMCSDLKVSGFGSHHQRGVSPLNGKQGSQKEQETIGKTDHLLAQTQGCFPTCPSLPAEGPFRRTSRWGLTALASNRCPAPALRCTSRACPTSGPTNTWRASRVCFAPFRTSGFGRPDPRGTASRWPPPRRAGGTRLKEGNN